MFDHNYLVYDKFGLKEVKCMSCGHVIKSRSELVSKTDPTVIIRELGKHSEYREIPVILSDNNIAFIMVCDACKFHEVEPEKVTKQIQDALKLQLVWEGKSLEVIDEILSSITRKVTRKAEPNEVAHVLKGELK